MAYTPRSWADGELVTAEDLNRIEQGVDATDAALDGVTGLAARLDALEYDSGWRALSGGENVVAGMYVARRIGNTVDLVGRALTFNGTGSVSLDRLPNGIRPGGGAGVIVPAYNTANGGTNSSRHVVVSSLGFMAVYGVADGQETHFRATYFTDNPIPTTPIGDPT